MRQGDNSALVTQIAKRLPVQVGGGIRSVERARQVLDAGARRVIIGSALFSAEGAVNTDFAAELATAVGAAQVVAGIDTKNGRIAVKGWKAQVELTPDDAIPQLEAHAGAFLYTHVDGEGLMQGFPIETAARLRKLTQRQLIVAAAFARSRRSMRWTRWAPMRWSAWPSTPSCSRSDAPRILKHFPKRCRPKIQWFPIHFRKKRGNGWAQKSTVKKKML